jgi:hypothetical protein
MLMCARITTVGRLAGSVTRPNAEMVRQSAQSVQRVLSNRERGLAD